MMNKGVFTTIKIHPRPMFLKEHFKRLQLGARSLNLILPISYKQFETDILKIKHSSKKNQALKVIFYKGQIIYELRQDNYPTNMYLLKVAKLNQDYPKLVNNLSFKQKNYPNDFQIAYLNQIRASDYDDVLLVDENNNILETLIANVFYIKNQQIYTPKLNNNILGGIVRQKIIENFNVKQVDNVKLDDLKTSDCVFVTNCLKLVQLVTKIDNVELKAYNLDKIIRKIT